MQDQSSVHSYQQLYAGPNQSSKVLLYRTSEGSCVLKRWLSERVRIGGNRSQPLAEYAALLDLQDVPNISAPIKITLEKSGVDFIYVYCGSDALHWRSQLQKEQEDDEQREQQAEQLAQHVAVHLLLALQEMSTRGLVHRDVKPTNILLQDFCGFTWLGDMGLTTQAQHLHGFVKGLDWSYLPPEYVLHNSQTKTYSINDDLAALAQVTTTAVDMYQLGLTIYHLIHGSMPSHLTPKKGVSASADRLSELLFRVATFNWQREIARNIASSDAAELLEALLQKDPSLRPTPQEAMKFAWLQPVLQPALQLLEQQRQQWPAMQQQALLAAKHMELQQLQQDIAALKVAAVRPASTGARPNRSSSTHAAAHAATSDTLGWDSGTAAAGCIGADGSGGGEQHSYASASTAVLPASKALAATVAIADIYPGAAADAWGSDSSNSTAVGGWGDANSSSTSKAVWDYGSSASRTAESNIDGASQSKKSNSTGWQQQQQQPAEGATPALRTCSSTLAPCGEGQYDGW